MDIAKICSSGVHSAVKRAYSCLIKYMNTEKKVQFNSLHHFTGDHNVVPGLVGQRPTG
jgi:hypothetical protein